MQLDIEVLKNAVSGTAAAFRCVTDYQPAGGAGDKVFPPTYEGGKYATENRIDPETGEVVKCVLLDSVQSQANRMELALLEAHRDGLVTLPLIVTRFDQAQLLKKFSVTSLEAPHRVADALFRDSLLNGVTFRKSDKGRILDTADIRNATGLFGLCPTALVFGLWDSTGPRGGLGAKFQRALVSEIVGMRAVPGVKTSSRIDAASIEKRAGPIFRTPDGSWTVDPAKAVQVKGKPALAALRKGKLVPYDEKSATGDVPDEGRPSKINHGNVTPDFDFAKSNNSIIYEVTVDKDGTEHRKPRIKGGFTIEKAVQSTVLSLTALRRLRFPLNDAAESDPKVDVAARTVLSALALAAGALARNDADLRSRCQLFAEQAPVWDLLDKPGARPIEYELTGEDALALLKQAINEAKDSGLPWEGEIPLTPSDDLVELVRRSQELASASDEEKG